MNVQYQYHRNYVILPQDIFVRGFTRSAGVVKREKKGQNFTPNFIRLFCITTPQLIFFRNVTVTVSPRVKQLLMSSLCFSFRDNVSVTCIYSAQRIDAGAASVSETHINNCDTYASCVCVKNEEYPENILFFLGTDPDPTPSVLSVTRYGVRADALLT